MAPKAKATASTTGTSRVTGRNPDAALWAPPFSLVFRIVSAVRIMGSLVNIINDCDETYNYYEPTHYLLYGFGMQTWEYSPEYALRSYSYILFHATLGRLFRMVYDNKIMIFFLIRATLGVLCAYFEARFYMGVRRQFGNRIGRLTLLFMLCGAGMFHASTSYLPASFAMMMLMLSFSMWMEDNLLGAVLPIALIGVCGWPFPALIAAPMAVHMVVRKGLGNCIGAGIVGVVSCVLPAILIDVLYFDAVVFPSWNTVMYNVMRGPEASALYGVDPWTYYVLNIGLNFNLVGAFGLLGPVMYTAGTVLTPYSSTRALAPQQRPYAVSMLLGMSMWLALMWKLPHKEERFLFPVYPLLALSASLTLVITSDAIELIGSRINSFAHRVAQSMSALVNWTSVLIYLVVSSSRIIALCSHFYAPIATYTLLSVMELSDNGSFTDTYPVPGVVNICTGKEWYRFPSSFFLPSSRFELHFIESGFKGELPQPFATVNGTSVILPNFNDMNREEPSRYINVEKCHYLIDLDVPAQTETVWSQHSDWEVVKSTPFLHHESTPSWARAFYIPFLTSKYAKFIPYNLLRNKKKVKMSGKAASA